MDDFSEQMLTLGALDAPLDDRLRSVLDNISGGLAVYQISPHGVKTLFATDGIAKMQGYTRAEFDQLAAQDALSRVYEDDRPRLRQELNDACRRHAPFACAYRVYHKEKPFIWVNLSATPIGVDKEGCLIYNATYTNASHQFELYRQLLDATSTSLMVSDRQSGEVYFTNRAAEGLLRAMDGDATQEQAARRLLAECPRQEQTARVTVGSHTYRVNAHFLQWMERPAVVHYFSDITDELALQSQLARQYEELKLRYDYELAQQDTFEDGVLERVALDLTDDVVLHAASPLSNGLSTLTGQSIETMARARLAHVKDAATRAKFEHFMDRNALLEAYFAGEKPTLENLSRLPGTSEKHYTLCTARLVKNPANGHIIAFIETRDDDLPRTESILMRRLLETNYEKALVFNAETGQLKLGLEADGHRWDAGEDNTFQHFVEQQVLACIAPGERERTQAELSLAAICQTLAQAGRGSGRCTLTAPDGTLSHKTWTVVYFDETHEMILFTISNITAVYERDLRNARELKAALEQARVASLAKNDFLARMSHEIRTPITTVAGILELLRIDCQNGCLTEESLLQRIDTADAANRYLLTLINDILDISKIESNELRLSPTVSDIRKPVRAVSTMIAPLAEKKHIRLSLLRKSRRSDWYLVDATRVQQILMNLLSNAVKFTPEGGEVIFTGEAEDLGDGTVMMKFVVRDTGVGISEEFKPHVFEPFKREYTDIQSGYEGTGIGLPISRSLARMMGGDVTFESEKGKGSTFVATLRLPLATVKPEADAQSRPAQPQLDGLHVLLCEDNQINQQIIQKLLEAGGCRVTAVDDGQQAVQRFAQSQPNEFGFILMDIRMPVMDGLTATREIRTLPRPDAHVVPIVAMSANAYEEDRALSLAAGMNDHLSKPVDTALLYATLQKYRR